MEGKMTTTMDQFTAVALDAEQSQEKLKKIKVPRKILHFSDGTLEEYSTDEEDNTDLNIQIIDPKTLRWLPWIFHYMSTGAKKSLGVADYCGEKLAWLFGITSPKYGYAIEEYNRIQKEVKEEEAGNKQDAKSLSAIDVQVVGSKEGPCAVKVVNDAPSAVEPKY